MSDKKKKEKDKDKDKKNTVEFAGPLSIEQTGSALIDLGERLLSGRFFVSNGKRKLEFTVGDSVEMSLRGKLSEQEQSLRIELSWAEGNPAKGPTLIFGEVDDPAAEEAESDASADARQSNGAHDSNGAADRKSSTKRASRSSAGTVKSKRTPTRNKRA